MKPVAICTSTIHKLRGEEFGIPSWEDWLVENGIPCEQFDCYAYDAIEKLDNYSALIWHYSNFQNADLMEAQHILDIAERKGLKVFPNHSTGWHFDDKIAESYAFEEVGAPTPKNWMFYDLNTCIDWLNHKASFPIVAKLRRGSGSNNVKIIQSAKDGTKYAKRMFSKGYAPAQSLAYKAYSKLQSSHDWKTIISRVKKIPMFLISRRFGKGMPVEKGYCYFQEFIPNDGFDLKVVVVGDKLTFLNRKTRKGDFRASGGGDIAYDRSLITKQIIDSAFTTADALKMQQVGFDYVVDNRNGEGKIIEMCFGFDYRAVYDCGGWYDRESRWHEGGLNVEVEMVKNLFSSHFEV